VTASRAGRGHPGKPMAAHQLASAYGFFEAQQLGTKMGDRQSLSPSLLAVNQSKFQDHASAEQRNGNTHDESPSHRRKIPPCASPTAFRLPSPPGMSTSRDRPSRPNSRSAFLPRSLRRSLGNPRSSRLEHPSAGLHHAVLGRHELQCDAGSVRRPELTRFTNGLRTEIIYGWKRNEMEGQQNRSRLVLEERPEAACSEES
jgi:hypothetical protein